MTRYDNCKSNAEANSFVKYKIIVPTEEVRQELLEAFKHMHDADIDTEYVAVNHLAHTYHDDGNIIIVNKVLYDKLDKK